MRSAQGASGMLEAMVTESSGQRDRAAAKAAEAEAHARWLGRVLGGRYSIEETLGSGAVGVVYRAHDRRSGDKVAVKVLSEEFGVTLQTRSRFEREGQVLGKLSHPNIVDILDYGVEGETPTTAPSVHARVCGSRRTMRQALRSLPRATATMPRERSTAIAGRQGAAPIRALSDARAQ